MNWERIAEIANQEIAASQRNTDGVEQKISGSETPTTPGLPHEETGRSSWQALHRNGETWLNVRDSFGGWKQLLAAFDDEDKSAFDILKILEEEHNAGLNDGKLRLACRAALEELEAYPDPKPMVANRRLVIGALREALTPSVNSRSTPTKEKQNPLVAPLVEALRKKDQEDLGKL